MRHCNERIALSTYSETYCRKEFGHTGEHSAGIEPDKKRCEARNKNEVRCGRPKEHTGLHYNGLLTPTGW
jgi:hypothetical protein